jgi:Flp pilus assembly protein TadD
MAVDLQRSSTLESQSFYNRALEKIARNRHREALNHMLDAVRIAPDNPLYLSYFGYCLALVEHDFDRATRYCQQAKDAMPLEPITYVNLGKVYRLKGDNGSAYKEFLAAWELDKRHAVTASELTRMGIRRPPFIPFLPRSNWCNRYLGMLRAMLERKLIGRRQC